MSRIQYEKVLNTLSVVFSTTVSIQNHFESFIIHMHCSEVTSANQKVTIGEITNWCVMAYKLPSFH